MVSKLQHLAHAAPPLLSCLSAPMPLVCFMACPLTVTAWKGERSDGLTNSALFWSLPVVNLGPPGHPPDGYVEMAEAGKLSRFWIYFHYYSSGMWQAFQCGFLVTNGWKERETQTVQWYAFYIRSKVFSRLDTISMVISKSLYQTKMYATIHSKQMAGHLS